VQSYFSFSVVIDRTGSGNIESELGSDDLPLGLRAFANVGMAGTLATETTRTPARRRCRVGPRQSQTMETLLVPVWVLVLAHRNPGRG
jgi:hypothetical protein